jgi:hypothetical protein
MIHIQSPTSVVKFACRLLSSELACFGAMATPIHPMFPPSCAAPKCGWPETRAVNRALRKAYGIGIRSVEEIGTIPGPVEKLPPQKANGSGNALAPRFETVSANSSGSTSSIPNW